MVGISETSNESSDGEEVGRKEFVLEIISWILFVGIIYCAVKGSLIFSLQTSSPMVGVSGDSMTHSGDLWQDYYFERSLDADSFPFQDGFQTGDLVILQGVDSLDDVQIGDVVVWVDDSPTGSEERIIHRVARVNVENKFVRTRSDKYGGLDERIRVKDIVGKAVYSEPYLGYPAG